MFLHGIFSREQTEVFSLERIIEYIKQKYEPLALIVYGSYANGTNDSSSDFDAMIIYRGSEQLHDTGFVDNTQLDLFVYPLSCFDDEIDCNEFVQIFDGRIIIDSEGKGALLQKKINEYLDSLPKKTKSELQADIDWCAKNLERAKRNDCEGMYRWHWVLIESLSIFCDLMQQPYLGPKKALKWMAQAHPEAFLRYEKALSVLSLETLEDWIAYILEEFNKA